MLEALPREKYDGVVHRLAGARSVERTATKLGLVGADLDDFIAAVGVETLAKLLLADPFDAKIIPDMPPYGLPTRFSDGTFPVFYAAEARETSEREIAHHHSEACRSAEKPFSKHMWAFHCTLNGRVVDVSKMHGEWAWLTSQDTCDPNCLDLGKIAFATTDVDALRAPSARHGGGTTVPTFKQDVLSNPVVDGTTYFSFDAVANRVLSQRRDGTLSARDA